MSFLRIQIFFYSISGKLVLWIIFSTLSIHHFGLWFKSEDNKLKEELLVENCNKKLIKEKFKKKRKRILLLAIFIHFEFIHFIMYEILNFYKYVQIVS